MTSNPFSTPTLTYYTRKFRYGYHLILKWIRLVNLQWQGLNCHIWPLLTSCIKLTHIRKFLNYCQHQRSSSTPTWYTFLSLCIRSQWLYMFQVLLAHLQHALCADYVQVRFHRNLHVANTHLTHVITPNNICTEPHEDGRAKPETCKGIGS
jgi:hypothetical protein